MPDELPAQWGILELMGHKVLAGKISGIGHPLLRIDIPETTHFPEFTQWYGEHAIYAITPVSEEVARKCAQDYQINPISVYAPSLVNREELQAAVEKIRELNRKLLTDEQDDPEGDSPF